MPIDVDEPVGIPSREELERSLASGPATINGPGDGWCIQALLEDDGGRWYVEVLDPVKWQSGPALPDDQLLVFEHLGLEPVDAGWALSGAETLFSPAGRQAAEMMLTLAGRAWGVSVDE